LRRWLFDYLLSKILSGETEKNNQQIKGARTPI